MATVLEGREVVNHLDPLGVGARDLRECLLIQIAAQRREAQMVLKRARRARQRVILTILNCEVSGEGDSGDDAP